MAIWVTASGATSGVNALGFNIEGLSSGGTNYTARVEGFIVSDFRPQFPKAYAELIPLWRSGQLTYREHLVHGLENAPAAVNMLFDGKNHGKLILQVATDGTSS